MMAHPRPAGTRPRSPAVLAILALGACSAARSASGTGGDATGGGGATPTTTTTPSNGGTGGSGATTSGGTGGTGGGTTTTTTTTTTTSSGGTGGGTGGTGATTSSGGTGGGTGGTGTGGGGPTGHVVALAGSGSGLIGGVFTEGAGWSVTSIVSTTSVAPAVALESATAGVALFRSAADSHLLFTKWDGAGFSPPLGIGMLAVGQGGPSMVFAAGAYPVGYWGTDNKHWFAKYAGLGGGWSPVAEAVQPMGGGQSFGSSPPALTGVGADFYLVHAGTDGKIYEQPRIANAWSAAVGHDVGGVQTTISPTVVALSGNAEDMMIVYVVTANSQIGWLTRKTGAPPVWNNGALIANALTQDRVAVAALPGGGAVMAFRGTNTNLYTSRYTPGANPPWSAPAALANPNHSTPSSPAIAPGIGSADAELVFADGGTGQAWHSRLVGQVWQAPTSIGGSGVQLVGAASAP